MSSTTKEIMHDEEKRAAELLLDATKDISSDDDRNAESPLPTPVTATAPKPSKPKLSPAMIIPIWIVLSSSVILYNNHVYNTLMFKYPVFLVTFHLAFAAVGTRVLQRTTHLLDAAKDIHMSKDMFMKSILPIGMLFSGSLVLSNTAYLYLSVAYIQMLKVRVSRSFRLQAFSKILLGLHSRCDPINFMDVPSPRAEQETGNYCAHDFDRCRPHFAG